MKTHAKASRTYYAMQYCSLLNTIALGTVSSLKFYCTIRYLLSHTLFLQLAFSNTSILMGSLLLQ
jgi:hypothetical protein